MLVCGFRKTLTLEIFSLVKFAEAFVAAPTPALVSGLGAAFTPTSGVGRTLVAVSVVAEFLISNLQTGHLTLL